MRNRKEVLIDLLEMRREVAHIIVDLSEFPWDSNDELVVLKNETLVRNIRRALTGSNALALLQSWAETVEFRDDIGYENDAVQEIVYKLANPEINGIISNEDIADLCVE